MPLLYEVQFSQHPGLYLPHVSSGPVGLDSGMHTHMSSECLQKRQVLHF